MLAKPGAAEWPIARFCTKAGFDWIVLDIPHRIAEVFGVADIAIEILLHPKLTSTVQDFEGGLWYRLLELLVGEPSLTVGLLPHCYGRFAPGTVLSSDHIGVLPYSTDFSHPLTDFQTR